MGLTILSPNIAYITLNYLQYLERLKVACVNTTISIFKGTYHFKLFWLNFSLI